MSASMNPTFWWSITGLLPSLVSVRLKSSAYSNPARIVPTQAAPIRAAVQLNAPSTMRLPCFPGCPMRPPWGDGDVLGFPAFKHRVVVLL
jgi:hypothetical protein